jgi:hypothetical protein
LKALFIKAKLYVLAAPLFFIFLGSASNQAVIAANHDRFPVMLNSTKIARYQPDANGMIDMVHSVMQPTDHLKFLADWIDLQDAIYSPGDLLLMLGGWLFEYAPLVWALLMVQLALTGQLGK